MSNYQTSLDDYMDSGPDGYMRNKEVGEECIEETPIDSVEAQCECYSSLLSSLKSSGKFKLHPGSLFLYFRDGGLRVLADIDHVFHKCMMG